MSAPLPPVVVAAEMGYGHLRPALSLCQAMDVPLHYAERPPLASADEVRTWQRTRKLYDWTSRVSQVPVLGAPLKWTLDAVTAIPPLHPERDLTAPDLGVRQVERMGRSGLCAGLVGHLRDTGAPLLTTFYAPAVLADAAGHAPVWCVITDSDCARVWVPAHAKQSRIQYLAPSERVRRRLLAYGVAPERVHLTGFPLPPALLGGPDLPALRQNLARRLRRLDPTGRFVTAHEAEIRAALPELDAATVDGPPQVLFAVGGAGAQAEIAIAALPSLRPLLERGELRLCLVAGTRPVVAERFRLAVEQAGLTPQLGTGIEILVEPEFEAYVARFNQALARTDVLWTKPSEMTFYGALGLPLLFAPSVGVQEKYNRRWAMEQGAGVDQRRPEHAASWLQELLHDGTLAAAAWAGFQRLPKHGTYRIAALVGGA